ncbi:MAG: branched-chain amino acid ABC transporter permease [Desulfobacterales bacterium]|jgi:urea transport system permease protein|nr:MAG: branched-chain amino acid ABC transporter permease [Desulfobacterales bacterium]
MKSLKAISLESKIFLIILFILLVLPPFTSMYQIRILSKFVLFAIFAMSLDLIWGYSGMVSFGHAAFFGLGAYSLTLLLVRFPEGGTLVAIAGSLLVPVVLALFMSFFLIYGKVSGVYFAIITLVVSLTLELLCTAWYSLTKGLTGFTPIPPLSIFYLKFDADTTARLVQYYYLIILVAALIYFILHFFTRSRYGLLLQAIKDNPKRAQFLGHNIAGAKTIAFILAAAIAGLAGGLYAPLEDFISPQLLGLVYSTQVIIWVAVGGRNTLIGPFIGTIILVYLETIFSGIIVEAWYLIIGIILVVVVLFWPDGLMGIVSKRIRK